MALGILGVKIGMTRVFNEAGAPVPVTVVQAGPCPVVQQKQPEKEGYSALQIGFGKVRRPVKSIVGHFKKSGLEQACRFLREFLVEAPELEKFSVGSQIKVDIFAAGEKVSVSGVSIGKGFQGVVKRHGFAGGPATHGSMSHRAPGSIGGSNPDRVPKGRRMGGRMGGKMITVHNLEVVRVDTEKNLLLLKGAVPGAEEGLLEIKKRRALKT
ncbi:MAG: 50S ribosomal protein L3 [Candidatus Omnitrophota bacterium]